MITELEIQNDNLHVKQKWIFWKAISRKLLERLYWNFHQTSTLLTLLLLNMTSPVLANSVDPDQLASEEANWSGSALFVKYVIFYQKSDLSNLIGWKLEVGVAS